MKLLLLSTKAPWPPIDGGRLLLRHALEGLAEEGLRPTLVAPVDPSCFDLAEVSAALAAWCEPHLVPVRPASPPGAAFQAVRRRMPLSIARHAPAAVRREVERLLASGRFDVVHAEQLQAFIQAEPARESGIPIVLRAQNVESDLWALAGYRGRLLAGEARRLARWEGAAVAKAEATLALTDEDAVRLRSLATASAMGGGDLVQVVRAPFPSHLPAAREALPGRPPLVVLGSAGWLPNADAVAWFLADVWPAVRAALPDARLHVFGSGAEGRGEPGVTLHAAPVESREAFPQGSIHLVPLRFGSGIRMKVLEAWARGVPVVATPRGAAGLAAVDGRELLLADGPAGFCAALGRLAAEPALAASLIEGGRAALSERHDPARLARQLIAVYEELARGRA